MTPMDRRTFLGLSSTLIAGTMLAGRDFPALAQDAVTDAPIGKPSVGYGRVQWKVQPFPMTAVRLRQGPMLTMQQRNSAFLKRLPNDRLLHMFRVTAGLPSTVEPLGGWEAPDCELRGHYAGGHILSACALMYASTGDTSIRDKGNELVAELASCQQSDGYLAAYPTTFYDRLRNGEKVWAPFYTYHKILAGHIDMYTYCGNQQALHTAERMAGWASAWVAPLTEEQFDSIKLVEYGGMNEALFNLYAITEKPEYRALAFRFEQKKFFDPLAADIDELAGNHANTNIPKIIGASRGYELTGDNRYHAIAANFWNQVLTQHSYATGGTSNGEYWHPVGTLSKELGPSAQECCCAYNMMKLSRHIYGWTADPKVADQYERMLWNVRHGTQDENGMLMYYVSLEPGLHRTFGTELHSFWCCTGTGSEEYSKANDSIYWHDGNALYVNQFIGSEVVWDAKGIHLIQDTNFPHEETSRLTIRTAHPVKAAILVRVPYWAAQGLTFHLNGKPKKITAAPGAYAKLHRKWRDGDRVDISLPMQIHVAALPETPGVQAAMYGPLVLAALIGDEPVPAEDIYGPSGPSKDSKKDDVPMPEITAQPGSPTAWLRRVPGPTLMFETVGQPATLKLRPLTDLYDQRYSVYWRVNTSPEKSRKAYL